MANLQEQFYWDELEKELPPIVFRNWKRWGDFIPISPRSVANDDCLGRGPKEKLTCGRVCGYPRKALILYLRSKERTKIHTKIHN